MASTREFFSDVKLDGLPLAAYQKEPAAIRDRNLLKDFLEYTPYPPGAAGPV